MAKPILFINISDDFFRTTTEKKRTSIVNRIKKQTDNEYHVILHNGVIDIKCVNGENIVKYL
jgi:hypothetical protein